MSCIERLKLFHRMVEWAKHTHSRTCVINDLIVLSALSSLQDATLWNVNIPWIKTKNSKYILYIIHLLWPGLNVFIAELLTRSKVIASTMYEYYSGICTLILRTATKHEQCESVDHPDHVIIFYTRAFDISTIIYFYIIEHLIVLKDSIFTIWIYLCTYYVISYDYCQ